MRRGSSSRRPGPFGRLPAAVAIAGARQLVGLHAAVFVAAVSVAVVVVVMLDLGWRSAARRLRRNQARRGFFAFRARWRDGAVGARVAVGVTLRGFIRDTADCRR